ncbi:MAG: hypothetical protein IPM42_06640 [Saprospiraceae bacterium]|nr:hypothetical protein [Saprospiraceae bacterium]
MLPRIIQILEIKDFIVKTLWTSGEVRNIDFEKLISNYPVELKNKIVDKKIFATLSLNMESKTIYFPGLLTCIDEKGNKNLTELDFCPDVLYSASEMI